MLGFIPWHWEQCNEAAGVHHTARRCKSRVAARLRAQQPDRMRRIGVMMATRYRTRRFAVTLPILLVMLLVSASAAVGQPAPRVARVGMLCTHSCTDSAWDA